jgi:hypothetical protein
MDEIEKKFLMFYFECHSCAKEVKCDRELKGKNYCKLEVNPPICFACGNNKGFNLKDIKLEIKKYREVEE